MSTTTTTIQEQSSATTSTLQPSTQISNATRSMHHIPTFTDKHAEREWAKGHMAAAFRTFARLGYADGASGHISLRDPVDPECFWINPYAMHFALIKASDLVLVNEDGEPMMPTEHKVNTAGFIIHSAIHKARPDLNAACHMHSPHGRAWSSFGKPIEMLNQDSCMFYDNLAVYEGFGGVVLAREEGKHISNALGSAKKNLILQNHGILTTGGTVDEAVAYFIALERACHNQILAEAAAANGVQKRYVGTEEAVFTCKSLCKPEVMYMQYKPEYDLEVVLSGGGFLK